MACKSSSMGTFLTKRLITTIVMCSVLMVNLQYTPGISVMPCSGLAEQTPRPKGLLSDSFHWSIQQISGSSSCFLHNLVRVWDRPPTFLSGFFDDSLWGFCWGIPLCTTFLWFAIGSGNISMSLGVPTNILRSVLSLSCRC